MSIVFNFALRSIVFNFIIILINQIAYKHKLIPLVFKAFQNRRQCFGRVVDIVVEKHNTTVFNLACNSLTDAIRCGVFFPVK